VRQDAAITAAAVAAWAASEAAKPLLAPARCRICSTPALDAAARDALVWRHGDAARHGSDVLAFAIVPSAVAAHQLLAARDAGDVDAGWVDLLIVAQAAAFAADLNQLVKYAAGRERPFVHYGNRRDPMPAPDPDDNLSFYSGHTTLAFSLAAGAGTVSSLRGYGSAPWVWAGGLAGAAAVGWLRIAADKHYLTDVLAGAVLGTAIGVAVPRLLHGREPSGDGASQPLVVPLGIAGTF
jgi:membrane-associated phospholipid phosphatase